VSLKASRGDRLNGGRGNQRDVRANSHGRRVAIFSASARKVGDRGRLRGAIGIPGGFPTGQHLGNSRYRIPQQPWKAGGAETTSVPAQLKRGAQSILTGGPFPKVASLLRGPALVPSRSTTGSVRHQQPSAMALREEKTFGLLPKAPSDDTKTSPQEKPPNPHAGRATGVAGRRQKTNRGWVAGPTGPPRQIRALDASAAGG